MDFNTYVRKPFVIEAVEITIDNIQQIADLLGTLKTDSNGSPFIALDRRVVPNMNRAHIGWFMTSLGDNYRCYSPKAFAEQFVLVSSEENLNNVTDDAVWATRRRQLNDGAI